jgi:taurine dioxygenase
LDTDESEATIQEAYAALYRPNHYYSHEWQLHDLVVWDNIALVHARGPVEPTTRRNLRRVVVGDRALEDMLSSATGIDAELMAAP